jgi:hypothetical protein
MNVNEFCCNAIYDALEAACPRVSQLATTPVNQAVTQLSVAFRRSTGA